MCAILKYTHTQDFFDVTLACEEEQVQAHKVILSACSPFFRAVLRKNPHSHPLLYLKGVKCGDMQAVLNFMYHGEVNVAQEDLNSFLSVAEELKVKGLTQDQSVKGGATKEPPNRSAPAPPPSSRPRPSSPSLPAKKPRPVPAPRAVEDDEVQELAVPTVKTEPVQPNQQQQHGGGPQQQEYHTGALQELDQQVLVGWDFLRIPNFPGGIRWGWVRRLWGIWWRERLWWHQHDGGIYNRQRWVQELIKSCHVAMQSPCAVILGGGALVHCPAPRFAAGRTCWKVPGTQRPRREAQLCLPNMWKALPGQDSGKIPPGGKTLSLWGRLLLRCMQQAPEVSKRVEVSSVSNTHQGGERCC